MEGEEVVEAGGKEDDGGSRGGKMENSNKGKRREWEEGETVGGRRGGE